MYLITYLYIYIYIYIDIDTHTHRIDLHVHSTLASYDLQGGLALRDLGLGGSSTSPASALKHEERVALCSSFSGVSETTWHPGSKNPRDTRILMLEGIET